MPCRICGAHECKKHTALLSSSARPITAFTGSSPPEIFVGRWRYPNVYAGILSPQEYGDTAALSSPEEWHRQRLPIPTILKLRNRLIYARDRTSIKKPTERFISVMQELAMAHRSVAAEFTLKKPVAANPEKETHVPLITNAAPLRHVRLQENPKVQHKVDELVSDTEVKAKDALLELEKSNIPTSTLIKLLSAGLLGQRKKRKLVPTRWSITAVDDTLSKEKLMRIRHFPEISEILLFHADYLGNYYEFLLLPDKFAFEVIEHGIASNGIWHDYEGFEGRTTYAESVTGAYYANRLALSEYLARIQRQAQCIVFREIHPEYHAPLGVGILRQLSREAFSRPPERFATKEEALARISSRFHTPLKRFLTRSVIVREFGKQARLSKFF